MEQCQERERVIIIEVCLGGGIKLAASLDVSTLCSLSLHPFRSSSINFFEINYQIPD